MLVEGISSSIAKAIKNANPKETASIEVLEYGLKIVVNAMLIVLITLFGSSWFSSWINGIVALFSFALLRFFSGGLHIKSSDKCIVVSAALLIMISSVKIDSISMLVMNAVTLVLISLFAPNNIHVRYKKIHIADWMLKVISLIIVLVNMIFLNSEVVSFSFFVQGLTIINFDWIKWRMAK